ncbi:hypothetical protein E2542_SST25371 [Spatholobus suberectus]|nr:hypothetical protein E2542_SST30378 [Spatholobus suberectus]TKY53828.1 hypothetical protein E2542_SST25371 [Spatholobus suberectus]
MKNVAKCDTWCELQNPVNHRVFERKLRPKPLGRGHACLGVTHRCPPASVVAEGVCWLPASAVSRLAENRVRGRASHNAMVDERRSRPIDRARPGRCGLSDPCASPDALGETSVADRAQVPWKGAPERVRAPSCPDPVAPRGAVGESGCLGMQPQSGGKFRPRLNTGERPIANKYREGKMKRTLKRESKSA